MSMKVEATDEKSLEDIAKEVERDFQALFEDVNPFQDGITNVTVTYEQSETQRRRKRSNDANGIHEFTMFEITANMAGASEEAHFLPGVEFGSAVEMRVQNECSKLESCGEIETKAVQTTKPENAPKLKLYNWMGTLPEKLKNLPLTLLAIPGTHQSATYAFEDNVVSKGKYPSWLLGGENSGANFDKSPEFLSQTYNSFGTKYREVLEFYAKEEHLGRYNNNWSLKAEPDNEIEYFKQWNQCLRQNTTQQLQLGIRYFDYR